MIKFSLIICTLNRKDLLRRCLASLKSQTYSNYEIIIVDQSDKVNEDIVDCDGINYIHINQKGLSHARNVALDYARGEYVCLIDDDAVYPEDWLMKNSNILSENNVDVLCGVIEDPVSHKYALKGARRKAIEKIKLTQVMNYGLSTCCTFKRTSMANGFDEKFGVGQLWGAGEETDLIWRIIENKGIMKFDPRIVVFHPVLDKEAISKEKIKSYNLGFGALYAKHFYRGLNKEVIFLFVYSLIRSICGILFFSLLNKRELSSKQYIALNAKLTGFVEYKRYMENQAHEVKIKKA